jgi:hypothetical protein
MYLCTFDIRQIQKYIFSSNKLKDNLGGSVLVKNVLGKFLYDEAEKLWGNTWDKTKSPEFFNDTVKPVLKVFTSGGNAQIIVRKAEEAEMFTKRLLSKVMEECPDLDVAANVMEWPEGKSYKDVVMKQQQALFEQKNSVFKVNKFEIPSVCIRCENTGQPAISFSKRDYGETKLLNWRSESVFTRQRYEEFDRERLIPDEFNAEARKKIDEFKLIYSNKIDLMRGRKDEKSYIGVIHIDVNGMGKKFTELIHKTRDSFEAVDKLATASQFVDNSAESAFRYGIEWIISNIDYYNENKDNRPCVLKSAPLYQDDDIDAAYVVPVRKILVAGDDITLICEGTIALDLAAVITRALVNNLRKHSDYKAMGACAGVCLGKAHAPFSQLYQNAENACRKAKIESLKNNVPTYLNYMFLDKPDFTAESETRGCKPFSLEDPDVNQLKIGLPDWWTFREKIMNRFQDDRQLKRRTQIKNFESDLLEGEKKSQQKREIWKDRNMELEFLFEPTDLITHFENRSPYIEAVDLMDFIPKSVQFPNNLYNKESYHDQTAS